MIELLKLANRAVAKKAVVPGLCLFRIEPTRIVGGNGEITISVPIATGHEVGASAVHFMNAINACDEDVNIAFDGQFLEVRSGKFRAAVPCLPITEVPSYIPEGPIYVPQGSILEALKTLEPFMGFDASRPWACGVLLSGDSAFATNNIVMAQHWLGWQIPIQLNLPASAVREVLSIGKDPTHIQADARSATFHYEDGTWLRTVLLSLETPNYLDKLESLQAMGGQPQPVHPELIAAVKRLARFVDDLRRCYLLPGRVSTVANPCPGSGALVETESSPGIGVYGLTMLEAVLNLNPTIDFSVYPTPAFFFSGATRGVLCGMRES